MSLSTSADVLRELSGDTDQKIEQLGKQRSAADIDAEFAKLNAGFDEASRITNKQERSMREKILTATLQQLRKQQEQEQSDLSEAVLGLTVIMDGMGQGLEDLLKPSASEEALVRSAEDRLALAKQ